MKMSQAALKKLLTPLDIMEKASRFVDENLGVLTRDLITFQNTSVLQNCSLRELERMLDPIQPGRSLSLAEHMIQTAAINFAATRYLDAKIMDWLEWQHVAVRTPARYGSRANFVTSTSEDDGDVNPNSLRKLALKAIEKEQES